MHELLAEARRDYEVIIIDAPPLLPVTDAAVMASQTDGAILVVRHGRTTKDQVAGAVDRLASVGSRPLGVVFNMMAASGSGGYGYGYGYAPDAVATGTAGV
jgi:Mrp family chromosome partitioning ATPase